MRLIVTSAVVFAWSIFASVARADDSQAETAPNGTSREEELAQLRARLDKLEAEEKKRAAVAPSPWTLSGYAQTDWTVMRQSSQDEVNGATGEPLNENRFVLRRGHLRADADYGYVLGSLEIDANTVKGPIVRPIDAEVSVRWPDKDPGRGPFIMVTAGLMKTPFGFEVIEADNKRPFLERSAVARALFPGEFDLGLRVKGGWRFLTYALGIMNGDPIGERQFPGRDPNKSKDLVFRIGANGAITEGVRIDAGFSGLSGSGFHEGTPTTKDVLVWRDVNEDGIVQSTEVQVIAGSAMTPSQNFHRFALGGDLRIMIDIPVLGELTLRGEVMRASNLDRGNQIADPVAAGRDLRELGWYVGFTQEVTTYGIVGLRYDRYDPDADARDQQGLNLVPKDGSFSTLSVLGGLRLTDPAQKEGTRPRYVARLLGQYDHNDNALGRTSGGIPTTLEDDTFTVRAEVSF